MGIGDNGEENGNYYIIIEYILGVYQKPLLDPGPLTSAFPGLRLWKDPGV